MNFLAHLYLSGSNPHILIGNFIADTVKGKAAILNHPPDVQKGIFIHRDIDFFMDNHPLVKDGVKRLRPNFSKFSTVIIDIFYDHFLAKNWHKYSPTQLDKFTQYVYGLINENHHLLTEKAKFIFPHMRNENWLLSYQNIEGVEQILTRMSRRINREINMQNSVNELKKDYSAFEKEFESYFDDVINFISQKHNIFIK